MPTSLTRKNHLSRSRHLNAVPNLSIVIPSQNRPDPSYSSNDLDDSLNNGKRIQKSDHSGHDDSLTMQFTAPPSPTSTVLSLNNTLSDEDDQEILSSSSPATPWTSTDGVYSNFYLKLPNGKWRVRCRTGDRKIIGTYEVDGSMI